jgi:alkylation response protein AidB-like acyl-CoA dehydrogenase
MDLGFSEDQDELRQSVRRFIDQQFPRASVRTRLEAPESFDAATWQRAAQLGWSGLLVAEEHGGGSVTSQPLIDLYVLVEELGRSLQPWPVVSTNIIAAALADAGSDEQRKTFLAPLLAGEVTAAWCVANTPLSGADDRDTFDAARNGDGYRLTGIKPYVLDGQGSEFLLVDAVVAGSATRFIVPTATSGVTVVRRQAFDLTRRIDEVHFADVVLSADAVLDEGPEVAAKLEQDLRIATAMVVADSVGGQEAITEMAIEYAKIRVAFGRLIGSFQSMKHKLANMHSQLEASRATAYYAALAVNDRSDDADYAVSAAKSYVNDAYVAMANDNVQAHGGTGFTWEHDAHLYLRRAMTNQLLFGDSRDHRERVFALATDG